MSFLRHLRSFTLLAISLRIAAQSSEPVQPKMASLEDTASLVGVLPDLTELQRISANFASADRWQILWLHQRIFEKLTAVSFQVDATIAQIDNEIARASEVRSYLADRRDHTVNRANLMSIIFGGALGASSSGLQLSSTLSKPAAGIGIGAGTILSPGGCRAAGERKELRPRI